MKPTLGNIRKVASETTDLKELARLKDHVAFHLAGAKEAAAGLGKSVNAIAEILDHARAAEDFINNRMRDLGS